MDQSELDIQNRTEIIGRSGAVGAAGVSVGLVIVFVLAAIFLFSHLGRRK